MQQQVFRNTRKTWHMTVHRANSTRTANDAFNFLLLLNIQSRAWSGWRCVDAYNAKRESQRDPLRILLENLARYKPMNNTYFR